MLKYHEPVLLEEVLGYLKFEGWVVDATLGDGGHSSEILKREGRVLGLDVDPGALSRAKERFEQLEIDKSQYKLFKSNFRDLKNILQTEIQDGNKIQAVIFDLGVSSEELDNPTRGFSFLHDGPLDMRMDPDLGVKALDLINGLNKGELYELFTRYGDERLARSISEAVVSAREITKNEKLETGIITTKQLADLVVQVYRKYHVKPGKIHPATKVFQALRMAVNDELNAIKEALPEALEVLTKNGLILVISFHSLEDRIVKSTFRDWESEGFGEILTKKPVVPGDDEINRNPRSRSAKLRVFKKNSSQFTAKQ